MDSQKKLTVSAIILVVLGGIAVLYGIHGLPPAGGAYPNPNATLDPLARAAGAHYINGGSLFFGLLAIVALAWVWRTPAGARRA